MKTKGHGQISTTNLKQRFFLWSAIILIGGGFLLSVLSFWNTRRLLMDEAMPNYIYRRVSLNPHNPRNLADSLSVITIINGYIFMINQGTA